MTIDPLKAKIYGIEEGLLYVSTLSVEQLMQKYPGQQAKLQEALNLIKQGFSKIILLKYGVNVTDFLSKIQDVAALNAQIASVTTQINDLTSQIDAKNALIATKQAQIAANTAQSTANLATISTLDAEIAALAPAAANATNTINGILGLQIPGSLYEALTVNGYGDVYNDLVNAWTAAKTHTPTDVNSFLAVVNGELSTAIADIQQNGGVPGSLGTLLTWRNALLSAADPLVQTQGKDAERTNLILANASLGAANQALSSEITVLQIQIAPLVAQRTTLNTTLAGLNAQLAAAQSAVTFFNSLTNLEKTLFRELYPEVVFPV